MQPSQILVRSPNWIGDQILAFPFFFFLRRAYPRARIAVSCVNWVESIQYRHLINDVFVIPKAADSSLLARWRALEEGARELRRAGSWDLGFALPNSFSSAWLLFRAGVRARYGWNTDGRSLFLNRGQPLQDHLHRAESYVALLPGKDRPTGPLQEFWGLPAENELDSDIPGVLASFDWSSAWGKNQLTPPREPYWVLAPGSAAPSRRWDVSKFTQLARAIREGTGLKGVIVGGVSEAPLAAQLAEDRSLQLTDLTAQGPVSQLAEVFAGARFTVANDSGLAHVASLCGSFVHIVWGAGDPKRTSPMGPGRVRMSLNPVDCWPCERNSCAQLEANRQYSCIQGIEPQRVWEEIKNGIRPH